MRKLILLSMLERLEGEVVENTLNSIDGLLLEDSRKLLQLRTNRSSSSSRFMGLPLGR